MPRMRKAPKARAATFVEHDLHDSAAMMTFDADHQIWTDNCQNLNPIADGDFVRLYPPMGTTPERVEALKRHFLDNCDAGAVKVMATPVEAVPDAPEPTTAQPERPIRQVVMDRAARTQGVRDQSALADLLTQCMDKAGI